MAKYDSSGETLAHIERVGILLGRTCDSLSDNKQVVTDPNKANLVDLLRLLFTPGQIRDLNKRGLLDGQINGIIKNTKRDGLITREIIIAELEKRKEEHDKSKLEAFEKPYFDRETKKLKHLIYQSPEYDKSLERLYPALNHHYEHNRHHPGYFEDGRNGMKYKHGINGMNAVDATEMLKDWSDSSKRNKDGSIHRGIEQNKRRFMISDQLGRIFHNTVNSKIFKDLMK